jgi:hypothetical protein
MNAVFVIGSEMFVEDANISEMIMVRDESIMIGLWMFGESLYESKRVVKGVWNECSRIDG